MNAVIEIGGQAPTNGAADLVEMSAPYTARVELTGVSDMLFHRWNVEAIEEKARARKGSELKKTDNPETFVYRDDGGELCVPGDMLRQATILAAKFKQDPRSPRKSAMDLYKAGLICLTPLAPLGVKEWDYLDRRRVQVQRQGVTRTRPALRKGWKAEFDFLVMLPEYISPADLQEVISMAGKFCGVGDYRPTYGRFQVTHFAIN